MCLLFMRMEIEIFFLFFFLSPVKKVKSSKINSYRIADTTFCLVFFLFYSRHRNIYFSIAIPNPVFVFPGNKILYKRIFRRESHIVREKRVTFFINKFFNEELVKKNGKKLPAKELRLLDRRKNEKKMFGGNQISVSMHKCWRIAKEFSLIRVYSHRKFFFFSLSLFTSHNIRDSHSYLLSQLSPNAKRNFVFSLKISTSMRN